MTSYNFKNGDRLFIFSLKLFYYQSFLSLGDSCASAIAYIYIYIYIYIFCNTGVWTQSLHVKHLHQPFFVMDFFEMEVSQTTCLAWHQTSILLISASWVARITAISHQNLAWAYIFVIKNNLPFLLIIYSKSQ
jgi:hypothetical protein